MATSSPTPSAAAGEIGLTITGAADASTLTIIDATPVAVSTLCPECSQPGKLRDHVVRTLVDLPVVGFPTRLHVRVPCFLCAARPVRGRSSRPLTALSSPTGSPAGSLRRLAIDRMSVSATAKALGIGWDLVNQVALDACRQLVYDDPHHLDGVRILGVDEHVWKHTRKPGEPSNLVTFLVDLTPLVDGAGPARLLDICPGRSATHSKKSRFLFPGAGLRRNSFARSCGGKFLFSLLPTGIRQDATGGWGKRKMRFLTRQRSRRHKGIKDQ